MSDGVTTGIFGDEISVALTPRIQIAATNGADDAAHQAFTATGGSATVAARMFVCETGTSVGGYGVWRSKQSCRYRPGQGLRYRFTGLFSAGVANSQQWAGPFSATEGLFVGYLGTDFGVGRRIAGAVAIHRLTLSAGAGGVETITITLDGVAFVLPATSGALSTSALAEFIAEQTGTAYTGWSTFAPQSVDSTVTWLQAVPAATAGAFTISSTGTAAGTFTTIQAGAANVITAASGSFVPRSSFNGDRSAFDPAKLNVYEIAMGYLGAGPITFRRMTETGEWSTMHTFRWPGGQTEPNMKDPTMRLGWIAASLGSTTNLVVKGASAAAFVEGPVAPSRDPLANNARVTAGTTEYVALALRVRGEWGGTVCQVEVAPHAVAITSETANRLVEVRGYLNPTMTGLNAWTRQATASAVDISKPATTTVSGGTLLFSSTVPGGAVSRLTLWERGVRLEPGDSLVITTRTISSTSETSIEISWHEI